MIKKSIKNKMHSVSYVQIVEVWCNSRYNINIFVHYCENILYSTIVLSAYVVFSVYRYYNNTT